MYEWKVEVTPNLHLELSWYSNLEDAVTFPIFPLFPSDTRTSWRNWSNSVPKVGTKSGCTFTFLFSSSLCKPSFQPSSMISRGISQSKLDSGVKLPWFLLRHSFRLRLSASNTARMRRRGRMRRIRRKKSGREWLWWWWSIPMIFGILLWYNYVDRCFSRPFSDYSDIAYVWNS